jgi:hypothetical protein
VLFNIRLKARAMRGQTVTDLRLLDFAVDADEVVHIAALIVRSAAGRSA